MIFLLLIYSNFILCEYTKKQYDISVSSVDNFPHNIDQDFVLNVRHPEIKKHHLYAVFILHVHCPLTSESQKLYIYPGYTTKLDHRLKETLFHVMDFHSKNFNTKIVLRFYREASECTFMVEYSAVGAEHIHLKMPNDLVLVMTKQIILYRPAKLLLSIAAEDGHEGGLSIGKKGDISCQANDGFPFYPPTLIMEKEISILKEPLITDNRVTMQVITALKDHGMLVTCKSGSVQVSARIRVFHHAQSVEIVPYNQQWFKQGSRLECRSVGGGFPTPKVQWIVKDLNETTKDYFTVSSTSETVSTILISGATPNDTRWSLNCSSFNVIPPLDDGGPSEVVNITIGINVAGSIMRSNYVWLAVVASIIVVVAVVVAIVCISSHVRRCFRSQGEPTAVEPDAPPEDQKPQYSMVPQTDMNLSTKEQECYV